MLRRKIEPTLSEAERSRWRIVRLDTHASLVGEILEADADAGKATMKQRGPDKLVDGVVQPSYETVVYTLEPGSIAIVGR